MNNSGDNIHISNLEFTDRKRIREIKEAIYDKTYMATIEFENTVDEKKL